VRRIAFGNFTHVGRVRSDNQDFFGKYPKDTLDLSLSKGQLFIIADGMGGHNAGRQASELAVNTLAESYFSATTEDIEESLRDAFQSANDHIYRYGMSNSQFAGMGTTCTALVLKDSHAHIGHIGDSRIYRISKRKILQLTRDHSKVAEMQRRGILTKEEAKTHPERSHLYRALGTRPVAEIDVINDIVLDSDRFFLMCTDGLFNHVDEKEMQNVVLSKSPQEAAKALVELANERGGLDNITVQVIQFSVANNLLTKFLGGQRAKGAVEK